jgi:hypothetical protein
LSSAKEIESRKDAYGDAAIPKESGSLGELGFQVKSVRILTELITPQTGHELDLARSRPSKIVHQDPPRYIDDPEASGRTDAKRGRSSETIWPRPLSVPHPEPAVRDYPTIDRDIPLARYSDRPIDNSLPVDEASGQLLGKSPSVFKLDIIGAKNRPDDYPRVESRTEHVEPITLKNSRTAQLERLRVYQEKQITPRRTGKYSSKPLTFEKLSERFDPFEWISLGVIKKVVDRRNYPLICSKAG